MIDFDAVLPAITRFEADLLPNQVTTLFVTGECWIASFLIGDLPCFFVGGPLIVDYRIYGTAASALGAIAHYLGLRRAAKSHLRIQPDLELKKPDQRNFGGGWHFLKVNGTIEEIYLVLNSSSGPREEMFSADFLADNAAYDAASADRSYL